jgi:short-subunit dehydrogenase
MKDPRSILITGASGGIGEALARAYARPGTALALTGRNPGRLSNVAAVCRTAGAEVQTALLDVTDEAAVRSFVEAADRRTPIDLVIANAGMTGGVAGGEAIEPTAEVRRMINVNFMGVCNTLHPLIPAMLARRRGQLALIGSLAGLRGMPYSPAYCASKAALMIYGDALRSRLRPSGIEVSIILAGFIDTALSRHVSGPKPLQWTAERAARVIRKKLSRGRSLIAFPFVLYVGTRMLAALPASVADRLLNRMQVQIRRYE